MLGKTRRRGADSKFWRPNLTGRICSHAGLRAMWLALPVCVAPLHAVADDAGLTGDWIVANKQARIRLVDCMGALWGVVSWEAMPGFDSHNPNPAKRTRAMMGVPIVLGMTQTGSNAWKGQIYNSAWGQTFSGGVTLEEPDTLRITGCLLFLCGGENWSRATEPAEGEVLELSDEAICNSVASER
jgi:uncharacterized protein (DUF2147 family)